MNFHKTFVDWDDFTHWGQMVKEMMRLDQLYDVPQSLSINHKDYPPIPQLFEYYWCQVTNKFNERNCLNALQLFTLAPLISIIPTKMNKSRLVIIFSVPTLLLLVPVVFFNRLFYQDTLVDVQLGIIGGFAIYQFITNKIINNKLLNPPETRTKRPEQNKDIHRSPEQTQMRTSLFKFAESSITEDYIKFINLCLTLGVLVLFKSTGIFYLFLIAIVALTNLLRSKIILHRNKSLPAQAKSINTHKINGTFQKIKLNQNKSVWFILFWTAFPFLAFVSWELRILHYNNAGQGFLNLEKITNLIQGKFESYQQESTTNFISAVFNQDLADFNIPNPFEGFTPLSITYFGLSIFFWSSVYHRRIRFSRQKENDDIDCQCLSKYYILPAHDVVFIPDSIPRWRSSCTGFISTLHAYSFLCIASTINPYHNPKML
jgi:hypothetical protein